MEIRVSLNKILVAMMTISGIVTNSFTLGMLPIFAHAENYPLAYSLVIAYDGGKSCRESNLVKREKGEFVNVPVDYNHLELGTTPIYSYFSRPFNPALPTVIFVAGGPGQASHFEGYPLEYFLEKITNGKFNLLQFDQRGLGCSQPLTEALYNSPDFYSSANTAKDMDELRKHYALNSVSVYGVSYGTVPSTIYASLFPKTTTALILEGVVYDGVHYPSSITKDAAAYLWSHLNEMQRKRLFEISKATKNDPSPLNSALIENLSNYGFYALENFLKKVGASENFELYDLNKSFGQMQRQYSDDSDSNSYNEIDDLLILKMGMVDTHMNDILICKELTGKDPISDTLIYVTNNGLVTAKDSNKCDRPAKDSDIYIASKYPVKVPTTYLQGRFDPRVYYKDAIEHYNNSSVGFAQFLLFGKSGHNPAYELMTEDEVSEQQKNQFADIMGDILKGHDVSTKIESINQIPFTQIHYQKK